MILQPYQVTLLRAFLSGKRFIVRDGYRHSRGIKPPAPSQLRGHKATFFIIDDL